MTMAQRITEQDARAALALAAFRLQHRPPQAPRTLYEWQVPPEKPWDIWLLLGGRGTGKTEAGARYVNDHANGPACLEGKTPHRIAIVAPSHDDAVDTCVRGETGLLSINSRIRFHPGASLWSDLTWANGSEAMLFGTFAPEDVERFRGPQHCLVWGDEFAAWRKLDEAWDMIQFGLRLGDHPHMILTTTPKRRPLLRSIMAETTTRITRGKTSEAYGLPEDRRVKLQARYGGTTIGRQELDAEIIDDVLGALWKREMIDASRILSAPDMVRVVVAIDPSATSTESADEAGIVAAGINWAGHGYVLSDESLRASPATWARVAIAAYHRLKADRIVAETNNGGEMVEYVIHGVDAGVAYTAVTASRGKQTRAEPISALYEQGKVHHVGAFPLLEDQMCSWLPGEKSPDRMDALVWALTDLMVHADNPWAGLVNVGGVA
jgi:phage terminase large subunit-like protein